MLNFALDECHKPFMEVSGLDFLLPLLSSPDPDIHKAALRGVGNLSIYYGTHNEVKRRQLLTFIFKMR